MAACRAQHRFKKLWTCFLPADHDGPHEYGNSRWTDKDSR